jgi:PIN domain nuclease of toxin-antitoxin system
MILLDTHVAIWLALDVSRLSRKAAAAIAAAREQEGGLAISALTLWEIAQLVKRGRVAFDLPLAVVLDEIEARFIVKPLTARIAGISVDLPASYPRDPVDRILGATALSEGLKLVTADEKIRESKAVKTIW